MEASCCRRPRLDCRTESGPDKPRSPCPATGLTRGSYSDLALLLTLPGDRAVVQLLDQVLIDAVHVVEEPDPSVILNKCREIEDVDRQGLRQLERDGRIPRDEILDPSGRSLGATFQDITRELERMLDAHTAVAEAPLLRCEQVAGRSVVQVDIELVRKHE